MTTITVVGRATADAELRYTNSGKAVCEVSLADNHRKRDGDRGQWVDDGTTFYRVTGWEYLAEQMADNIKKGQRIIAVGSLRNREYEHNGEKRRSLEIRAFEIAPALDKYPPKNDSFARTQAPAQQAAPPSSDPWQTKPAQQQAALDEAPF